MFEQTSTPQPDSSESSSGDRVIAPEGEPIEFSYRGRVYQIHAILSRWCESGGWWNRIHDGLQHPDDGARGIWRVEAAPIGAVTTFEIERDELTGKWLIRPTSRP